MTANLNRYVRQIILAFSGVSIDDLTQRLFVNCISDTPKGLLYSEGAKVFVTLAVIAIHSADQEEFNHYGNLRPRG